jgi:hypothetical protein
MKTQKKIQTINLRLSKEQKEKLLKIKDEKGYATISQYFRTEMIGKDMEIHTKLNEICKEQKIILGKLGELG